VAVATADRYAPALAPRQVEPRPEGQDSAAQLGRVCKR
jgi:hypothetical protein